MPISSDIDEFHNLTNEIKRLSITLKKLRNRRKKIESNIVEYLKFKEQKGVRYGDSALLIENKETRKRKKASECKIDSINILRRYGIRNAEEVLNELSNAKKGESTEVNKIKFLKPKK
jgi:hypothetical protein